MWHYTADASTDLCFTRQQNSLSIQTSFCVSEEERVIRLAKAQEHLLHACMQRQNAITTMAKSTLCGIHPKQVDSHPGLPITLMILHSKFTIPMIHNRQDQNISKQPESAAFLGSVMMEITNKYST
jgi:hypothetical protein